MQPAVEFRGISKHFGAVKANTDVNFTIAKGSIHGLVGENGAGKSERGPTAIEAIKEHKAVYLMAVGGAAYLVAQAIKKSRVVAFAAAS